MQEILKVHQLRAHVGGKRILEGLDLTVRAGEVHAIMGPNGSGKSTLAQVLAGHPGYTVEGGEAHFLGQDLLAMPAERRALEGLFLAFQYPVELPGVNNAYFLRTALNAQREHRGLPPLDAVDFLQLVKRAMAELEMHPKFLERAVNANFSGGEKKRNEILQMRVLEPRLALLDETDSGLDIDALRVVAEGVNRARDGQRAIVVITHHERLLESIVPDHVHVLKGGRIACRGDRQLARRLEAEGYGWLEAAAS